MSKYIGTPVVSLSTDTVDVTGDITTTDATPEVIIVNDTHEDTDGGREGKLTFKGQQSGGEETTLAEIQASHDGTSDDEKGDLIFKTNDGSDGANPTEAMRIQSDQKIGIGVNDPDADLDISGGSNKLGILRVTQRVSGAAAYGLDVGLDPSTGDPVFSRIVNDTVTEAMRIQRSTGNVGIGTSSIDNTYSASHALQISSVSDNNWSGTLILSSADGSSVFSRLAASTDGLDLINTKATNMRFFTNNAERMRISSSGYLGIGRTDPTQRLDVSAGTANQWACRLRHDGFGGTNYFLQFDQSGSVIGSVTGNGSSVTYATSSDYRLKENVTDISDGITRVKQLSPKRFNFIADADTTVDGFLAHEAATVVPEAVTGTKDAMTEEVLYVDGDEIPEGKKVGDVKTASTIKPQGIDQAKLVPLLTSALQEAIAKIETLETKVAALEGE